MTSENVLQNTPVVVLLLLTVLFSNGRQPCVFAEPNSTTHPSNIYNGTSSDEALGAWATSVDNASSKPFHRHLQKGQTEHGVVIKKDDDHHGGIKVASWRWSYVHTPFSYTAFFIVVGLTKIGYHHANFLSSIIPESCILIALGTAVGGIMYLSNASSSLPEFSSRTFFLFLLPPIILESAYSLHDLEFFKNVGTILLYAVVGTLLNCFLVGPTLYLLASVGGMGLDFHLGLTEVLAFSALISAVDPVAVLAIFQEVSVNKALYFLVFGESLLNDAVTVVMYSMLETFAASDVVTATEVILGIVSFFTVSLGGFGIGLVVGALSSILTKYTAHVRVVEPLALLGTAYLSYLLAEMVHFSGIISIIACGLMQAEYARNNISQKSCTTVKYFTKMLSAMSETIIFLFLGLVLVNNRHEWNTGFVLWATVLCLLYRFFSVYLLTFVDNEFFRQKRIDVEEQFIMAYGGLRGAVAFSLAIMLDETILNRQLFITATLFIILFTVFVQGITIKPLVTFLKIKKQRQKTMDMFTEINNQVMDDIMAGIEDISGYHSTEHWKIILRYFNNTYVKRWLQSNPNDDLTRVYTKVVLADHIAHLYAPATIYEDQKALLNQEKCVTSDEEGESSSDDQSKPCSLGYIDEMALPSSAPPVLTRQWSFGRKRRHTVVEGTDLEHNRERQATLLRRAMLQSPYKKYYQRYNRNLVEDEHQDMRNQLEARHLRARRLTLAAIKYNSDFSMSSDDSHDSQQVTIPNPQRGKLARQENTEYLLRRAECRRMSSASGHGLDRAMSVDDPAREKVENNLNRPIFRTRFDSSEDCVFHADGCGDNPKLTGLRSVPEDDANIAHTGQKPGSGRGKFTRSLTFDDASVGRKDPDGGNHKDVNETLL